MEIEGKVIFLFCLLLVVSVIGATFIKNQNNSIKELSEQVDTIIDYEENRFNNVVNQTNKIINQNQAECEVNSINKLLGTIDKFGNATIDVGQGRQIVLTGELI